MRKLAGFSAFKSDSLAENYTERRNATKLSSLPAKTVRVSPLFPRRPIIRIQHNGNFVASQAWYFIDFQALPLPSPFSRLASSLSPHLIISKADRVPFGKSMLIGRVGAPWRVITRDQGHSANLPFFWTKKTPQQHPLRIVPTRRTKNAHQ
jgi:hypothetical protein